MHGVKRVPVAERDPEKEARKLAAAAKVNALSTAMLERKRAGAHDEDSLALSMKVLELNPEFYSAWNFRRQILSTRIRSAAAPEAAVSEALVAELRVLEAAIGKNAKAYCLWTHRLWVIDQLVAQGDTTHRTKHDIQVAVAVQVGHTGGGGLSNSEVKPVQR